MHKKEMTVGEAVDIASEKLSKQAMADMLFSPIIYSFIAWYYLDIALDYARVNRIEAYKSSSRKLKECKSESLINAKRCLGGVERLNELFNSTSDFISEHKNDFYLLYYEISQDLKKQNGKVENEDVMIYLRLAMMFLELVVWKNDMTNKTYKEIGITITKLVDRNIIKALDTIKDMFTKVSVKYDPLDEHIHRSRMIIDKYGQDFFTVQMDEYDWE